MLSDKLARNRTINARVCSQIRLTAPPIPRRLFSVVHWRLYSSHQFRERNQDVEYTGTSFQAFPLLRPDCLLQTGVCIRVLDSQHQEIVTALSWLPDGSGFISGGLDRKIILWVRVCIAQVRQYLTNISFRMLMGNFEIHGVRPP